MSEVSRIDELKRALLHNEKEILVVNEKLSQEIFEKSKTYRFIRYAMQVNGYEVLRQTTMVYLMLSLLNTEINSKFIHKDHFWKIL